MLKRLVLAVLFLAALLIVAGYEIASFEHLTGEICSKSGNSDHENCAPYNLVAVWLWHILDALDRISAAITALATAAIGLFTYTLYNATTEHSQIHKRLTELTERQADISDQMRTGPFWPHLVVEEPRFDTLVSTNDKGARRPTATYVLRSIGEKTVILKSIRQEVIFDTMLSRTIDPHAPWPVTYLPMRGGDFRPETADYLEEVTDEVDREMRGQGRITRKRFFLVIQIISEDVFRQQHEFGWCFYGSRRGGPGLPYGGTTHNYRRIRKPEERI